MVQLLLPPPPPRLPMSVYRLWRSLSHHCSGRKRTYRRSSNTDCLARSRRCQQHRGGLLQPRSGRWAFVNLHPFAHAILRPAMFPATADLPEIACILCTALHRSSVQPRTSLQKEAAVGQVPTPLQTPAAWRLRTRAGLAAWFLTVSTLPPLQLQQRFLRQCALAAWVLTVFGSRWGGCAQSLGTRPQCTL